MTDTIENYRSQIALARTEIKNLRQQITALKYEHLKEIKCIKTTLNDLRCSNCGDTATSITSNRNGGDISLVESDCISYRPIGVIETTFQNKRGVPRQPTVMAKAKGSIIIDSNVFNNPGHALSGLEEFSHMWIIFHFHATESTNVPAKVAPPRLGGERRGVFSTRSPHRPCSLGLSLVKIDSIEGNKIHFFGVDMVNGTPVLDIKPYIPQYDYPMQELDAAMSTLERPPTEGISDVAEIANLRLDDETLGVNRLTPISNSMDLGMCTPLSHSPFEEDQSLDQPNNITPVSPSPESPPSVDLLDGNYRTIPIRRPDAERGAPDGQERYTPPQSAHLTSISHDGIRVASWINNPPSQNYEVRFTEDAQNRLNDLIGEDRAQVFKANIECLLSEDPRSHYVRTRYPEHEYSCVLEDLSISCVFDSNAFVCTIIAVRNADDLQT